MCDPTLMMVSSLALSAASTYAQVQNSNDMAEAQYEASARTLDATYKENTRLQNEANDIATANKSDRVREANRELATIRVAAGELGATYGSEQSLVVANAYTEGLDLSRIETNRKNQVESLQAEKRRGKVGYLNETKLAYNKAKSSNTSAMFDFVGSGLQIGATHAYNKRMEDIARNRKA